MIQVKFFAQLRESLKTDVVSVPWQEGLTVSGVITHLSHTQQEWDASLAGNLLCAVNLQMVAPDTVLSDGDEVALFPPVTGG